MRKTHLALHPLLTLLLVGSAHAAGGSIKGNVKLTGKVPERKTLMMKGDPFCAKQPSAKDDELVAGSKGELKNAVVRISKGAKSVPGSGEAVLDQQGCVYKPRVVVAQAGQTVAIKNSDQTLHNVHTYKGAATLFNQAQVFGMPPIKKKFGTGDVIKFKCDVHPWMTGWVLVTDNPHFAVTGDDGNFEIKDVPAGKYTVEIWHEKLGTKTQEVTVADGKAADVKVELAAK